MMGFVVSSETAAAILDGIEQAQRGRGLSHYWTTGAFPILTGEHAGKSFIPADDAILSTPLRNGLTPRDFPEFDQLLGMLGGLGNRAEIEAETIQSTDEP